MTRVVTPRLEAAITNLIGWSDEAMGMLDQRAREVGANHSMVAELGRELRAELLEALRETATPKATLLRDFADVNRNGFGQEDTGDHDEALRRRGYEVG